jgi:hypothetical protein
MIVECTVQQPTLLRTLRGVPSSTVVWERTDTTADGERLLLFWAECEDFDAFESAMQEDPTVTGVRRLVTFDDRRLYQAEQVAEGRAQSVYPSIVESGGIIQMATATREGWSYQIAFPDNDALGHFHEVCTEHDLEFVLERKYERSTDSDQPNRFGLSEKQWATLTRAVESGYFEVPRATDLDTLADEMGISHQAASERLRRAVDLLTRNTVLMYGRDTAEAAE